jgi:hypothetical protein
VHTTLAKRGREKDNLARVEQSIQDLGLTSWKRSYTDVKTGDNDATFQPAAESLSSDEPDEAATEEAECEDSADEQEGST